MEENKEQIKYGRCRFCGQANVYKYADYHTQEQADECATLSCGCYESRKYKEHIEAKQKREEDRKQDIKRAQEQIENMFGSGSSEYGLMPVKTDVKEMLLNAAIMVYDGLLKDISINITSSTKMKISKSPKGKLTIARSDAAVFKQEV